MKKARRTAGPFFLDESKTLYLFRSCGSATGAPTATSASRFLLRLLLARFANQRLARQPHFVALNREHLHQYLVAQLQLIADIANTMLRDLADVQQPVGAWEKLNESPELRQPHHFAKIRLADLRRRSDVAHHLQRRIATRAAGRENVHRAVFQHVNLHASSFDDRLDLLPTRTDQVANLVRRNVQLVQPRCVRRNRSAPLGQRLVHSVENFQPCLLGLRQSFPHHSNADAQHLDVHLQRRNSRARSRDLEVHIAVVIFRSGNIRQDRIFLVVGNHQAHRNSSARSLHRHASIHQRQRTSANRSHRRRPIRFQNVGNQPHRVRELRLRWQQIQQRTFCKRPVTNFAASRPAQELHFAHAERRKIVVQHEPLELVLLKQQVQPLHVFLRSQRQRSQRLRLSAREQRRAMHTRQQSHFTSNLPDLIERPPIRTPPLVQNVVAEIFLAQTLESALRQNSLLFVFFRNRRDNLVLQRI